MALLMAWKLFIAYRSFIYSIKAYASIIIRILHWDYFFHKMLVFKVTLHRKRVWQKKLTFSSHITWRMRHFLGSDKHFSNKVVLRWMTKETIICCQELTPHLLSQKFGIDVLDTNKDGIEIKISVIFNKSRCKLAVAGELFLHFQRLMKSFRLICPYSKN